MLLPRACICGHARAPRAAPQPEDLLGLLRSFSALTALRVHNAGDLLPDVAAVAGLTALRALSLGRVCQPLHTEAGAAAAGALGALTRLRSLELCVDPPSYEGLVAVPGAWAALTGLTRLCLSGHYGLRRLPGWLPKALAGLASLELRACGLCALPPRAAALPTLTCLRLGGNPLGDGGATGALDEWWPASAGSLTGLRELSLPDCGIVALPYGFSTWVPARLGGEGARACVLRPVL